MPPCVMHWLCVLAHCIGSLYDGAVTSAIGLNCGNPGLIAEKKQGEGTPAAGPSAARPWPWQHLEPTRHTV